jgi:hypothetical protein
MAHSGCVARTAIFVPILTSALAVLCFASACLAQDETKVKAALQAQKTFCVTVQEYISIFSC